MTQMFKYQVVLCRPNTGSSMTVHYIRSDEEVAMCAAEKDYPEWVVLQVYRCSSGFFIPG